MPHVSHLQDVGKVAAAWMDVLQSRPKAQHINVFRQHVCSMGEQEGDRSTEGRCLEVILAQAQGHSGASHVSDLVFWKRFELLLSSRPPPSKITSLLAGDYPFILHARSA